MRLNFKWTLASSSLWLLGACAAPDAPSADKLLIYYGNDKSQTPQIADYQTVVLDADHAPSFTHSSDDQVILGYVSVGEAKPGQLTMQEQHLVIRKNPDWNSDLVDIRNAEWQAKIIDEVVPAALQKGFDGVMLDTIDSPLHLETTDPETYNGMKTAAITLVEEIRIKHPEAYIMLNRGFTIWPEVAPAIDAVLVESILSDFNLKQGNAQLVSNQVYGQHLEKINALREAKPELRVYSVDYWDMTDEKGVRMIYRRHRAHDIIPYVTTPALDTIHPEPEASIWDSLISTGDIDA